MNSSVAPAVTKGLSQERGIRYLDLAAIGREGIPPMKWILPGWLAERDIATFAGGGGIGKTTTAADLAVSIASGQPWCGLTPTRAASVLYFDEEQGADDTSRLFLRLGAPHDNLHVAAGEGIRLDRKSDVARLESEIHARQPGVVILDSIQQAFGSAEENDATSVGQVYRTLFRLRDQYGTAFLLIHHKKKQPGHPIDELELVRGSTAHGTQASTVWFARAGAAPNQLLLRQAKRRGGSKRSLVIGYHDEGDDGPITLTGEGAVEDAETAGERAQQWVVGYLADRGDSRLKEMVEAATKETPPISERTVKRVLRLLLSIGTLHQPQRGQYELAHPGDAELPLEEL